MRELFRRLASLQLTVLLVIVLAVVLAGATIVESRNGTEAARQIYDAGWFYALQGLFALNVLAALVDRWPRNRYRVGFAITHTAMLVILAGACMTVLYKVDGQLALWEGESSDRISVQGADGEPLAHPLGFSVRLDDFQIDVYQGTQRPAMFRSKVTIRDAQGVEHAGSLQMNQPLAFGGYHFFQSSYQVSGGREMSVLSVARDPGQAVVFLGYTLLVGGMIVVFVTRLAQQRAIAERQAAAAARQSGTVVDHPTSSGKAAKAGRRTPRAAALSSLLVAALAGVGAASSSPAAQAAALPDAATVATVRALPIQHDGRTMPFDTFAREAVRTVTTRRAWPGIDPVAMVLGWAVDSPGWIDQPVVHVDSDEAAAAAGLGPGIRWASFRTLVSSDRLREAIAAAHRKEQREEKLTAGEKDVIDIEQRLLTLHGVFERRAIRPFPAADPIAAWGDARELRTAADFAALEARVRPTAPAHYPSLDAVARELSYNARRPARWAWLLLIPAAVLTALSLEGSRRRLARTGDLLAIAGFLVMTWGLGTRWAIAGRIPAANLYESLLFLGWGVGLLTVIAILLRNRLMILNVAATSGVVMALIDLLPMDGFIHPVPPVLAGTPWLAIHVPIIMLGYAALAIVTVFAHLVLGVTIWAPQRRDLAQRFSDLLYWYTHIGSILLITGILTGSIWAASSWGRYWGWDPKEVWSLVAFLAYMAILHAKFDQQIQAFGVAAASIGAFMTILMTYLGVNFVLASGLHSYGFGSSRIVNGMLLVAALEIAFVLFAWRAHRRQTLGDDAAEPLPA